MTLEALHGLPSAVLRQLAASLREGPLAGALSTHALEQAVGPRSKEVEACLSLLLDTGMSHRHIAFLAEGIADARERMPDPDVLFDLVLSGPEAPGIPTADTAAVVHTLFEEATSEVLLVGYAIHNGERLFAPLAAKMRRMPSLRVTFCLDIGRKYTDTSLASEIVRRFAHDFRTKHWPWPELPEVYYDARSLAETGEERSSLHAKCVVVDKRVALITSANFSEAAQHRNIEAGILVRYPPLVEQLAGYFLALRESGQMVRCALEADRTRSTDA